VKKIGNIFLILIVFLNLFFLKNFMVAIVEFNYPNSGISVELLALGTIAVWMVINVILFVIYLKLRDLGNKSKGLQP
jgi:hypothetical protein